MLQTVLALFGDFHETLSRLQAKASHTSSFTNDLEECPVFQSLNDESINRAM